MILDEGAAFAKVIELLPVMLIAFIWAMMAVAAGWTRGLFKPINSDHRSPVTGSDVMIGFGIFVIVQVLILPWLITVGAYLVTGQEIVFENLTQTARSWLDISVLIGAYIPLALFYFYYLSKDKQASIFGDNSTPWYRHFLIGAATWLIIFPLVLFWGEFVDILILLSLHRSPLEQQPVEMFRSVTSNPLLSLCMGLVIFGLVPFAEEFLFRGLLQSWFKTLLDSPKWGIVLAALIFALFHYSHSQGVTNIQLLSSLFLLGCFLGFLYERQRSLWASIGLHSTFNAVSVLLIINEGVAQ
ncbi:MAG: CPBP family intramembrane glutamic endopeptidase [Chlamydiales bacterium]